MKVLPGRYIFDKPVHIKMKSGDELVVLPTTVVIKEEVDIDFDPQWFNEGNYTFKASRYEIVRPKEDKDEKD